MAAEELLKRTREIGIHLWVKDGKLNFRAPRGVISAELRSELAALRGPIIDALSGPRFERNPGTQTVEIPEAFVGPWNDVRCGSIGVGYTNVTNLLGRFKCQVDSTALEGALQCLASQHDALRCRYEDHEDGLRLVFDRPPQLTIGDLSGCDPAAVDAAIAQAAQGIIWRAFEPGECLFRPFAFKLPSAELAVGIVAHHFVVDGWSFALIPGYWMLEYERQLRRLPAEGTRHDPLQYSDFLLGIANWSKTSNFQRRLGFWKEALRGAAPSLLPPDRKVDPDARSFHKSRPIHFDAERVRRLNALAASLKVTLSDVLVAGVVLALRRELNTPDICLRHMLLGRDEPRLLSMIGDTANPVYLRIRAEAQGNLPVVAQEVHRVTLDACANELPSYYVDELLRKAGTTGFVQTNFQLRGNPGNQPGAGAPSMPPIVPIPVTCPYGSYASPRQLQAHDINLSVVNGAVWGNIVYLEDVYTAETIERFVRELDRALESTALD